jgi:hypothetical protein
MHLDAYHRQQGSIPCAATSVRFALPHVSSFESLNGWPVVR